MIIERSTSVRLDDGTQIDGGGSDGLRMMFDLRSGVTPISRPSVLNIFNLSDSTAGRLSGGIVIDIGDEALYAGSIDRLEHRPEDAVTTITEIELIDASALAEIVTLRGTRGRVGLRFLVQEIARTIGLGIGASIDTISAESTVTDYSFDGPAREALEELLHSQALRYYISFGVIEVVKIIDTLPPLDIAEPTGMVGMPARTDDGYKATMRLTSRFALDRRCTLRGEGDYRITAIRHRGDTWSGPWTTELTMVVS